MKKTEINHYKNKMITETKEVKDLVKSYAELQNKLKSLKEKIEN